MGIVVDLMTWLLLISGAVFSIIGGFGIIRLPEFFSRMHAGGITDTLGAGLIIGGLMLQGGFSLVTVKLFMIIVFLIITSPTACHALAKSALVQGLEPELDGSPLTLNEND